MLLPGKSALRVEIIVADNKSTDNSRQIVESFKANSNLRVVDAGDKRGQRTREIAMQELGDRFAFATRTTRWVTGGSPVSEKRWELTSS